MFLVMSKHLTVYIFTFVSRKLHAVETISFKSPASDASTMIWIISDVSVPVAVTA